MIKLSIARDIIRRSRDWTPRDWLAAFISQAQEIERLREQIATLTDLLREVATKCQECGEIATWVYPQVNPVAMWYHCDECHQDDYNDGLGWEPYYLGQRIVSELDGKELVDES